MSDDRDFQRGDLQKVAADLENKIANMDKALSRYHSVIHQREKKRLQQHLDDVRKLIVELESSTVDAKSATI